MPPRHNPEFRDALGIASLDAVDGMATHAISRQLTDLEGAVTEIGGYNATLTGNTTDPLHGYLVRLSNGTPVVLEVEFDPVTGEPVEEDREFFDARNRLAVLRSRERSRGSRLFNFSFMKDRGDGPGGHGYHLQGAGGIQEQYDEQLAAFIARKIDAHPGITDHDTATEAMSQALAQEQEQVRVLETMAAELKSGNRFLNYFRNRKGARVAAGGAALAGATVVAPVVLAPAGAYVIGRTLWDGFQGWRTERLPHDDIRMAGPHDGDFSGRITDEEIAFERFVKVNGAEARAGSRDRRRLRLAHSLATRLVPAYYADFVVFGGPADEKPDYDELEDQAWVLRDGIITPMEDERLASDQTQSRRRHVAGLISGLVGGSTITAAT